MKEILETVGVILLCAVCLVASLIVWAALLKLAINYLLG